MPLLDSEYSQPYVQQRRREQNRVSQQTFREKKDQRIKELESQLQEAEGKDQRIKELESQLQEAEKKCELLGRDFAALLREHMKMKVAAHRNISNPLDIAVANEASVGQAPTNMQDMHQVQVGTMPEEPHNPNQDSCSALNCMEWIEQSTVDT